MENKVKTSSEGLIDPEMLNASNEVKSTNENRKVIKRKDGLFERKSTQVITEDGKQLLMQIMF